MNEPTCVEIATDWGLWQEYADPDATMTEEEFNEMEQNERLATIHELWPQDCNCGDDD